MRVSKRQERVLRAAAELSGETLKGFVLGAATERAEEVLDRAQRIELGREAFRRFVEAIDGPTEEMPTWPGTRVRVARSLRVDLRAAAGGRAAG